MSAPQRERMRIAAESGCALHTVDRFFTGRAIRPVSLARIQEAIERLYRPGQIADTSPHDGTEVKS